MLIVLVQRYDRKHGLGLGRKEVVGYGMHKFPLKEIDLNQKWMETGRKRYFHEFSLDYFSPPFLSSISYFAPNKC